MKPTRSAPATPDAHGPLTVRVLTDLTECQRFDALQQAEHWLGHRFPAGDRLYQAAEQDGQWVGLLLWCAPALHLRTATPGSAGTHAPALTDRRRRSLCLERGTTLQPKP